MKIIHQGVNPDTVPVRATCGHCHTTIEFNPIEAVITCDQRDGNFYTIACPTCKKLIYKDVPTGYSGPG